MTESSILDQELDDFIDLEMGLKPVVIFGKTFCKYSKKAKELLDGIKCDYNDIDLNEMGEKGRLVHEKLMARTGFDTVPIIFVRSKLLGGYDELLMLEACGLLDEYLEGSYDLMMEFDFDLVVIGGGAAGTSAAIAASKFGKKTCLVNYVSPTPRGVTWGLGGTCTNVGCVPKKLLHRAATLGSDLRDAPLYGWDIPEQADIDHDWEKMVSVVQDHIKTIVWRLRKDLIANGVSYLNGEASLINQHEVLVKFDDGNTKVLSTKNIIIAVGARPRYLDFPGAKENCITSDDIFSLKEFPGRTLIVGGSYVALEVASFLNSFKADVTVMVRSEILSSMFFDREMAHSLELEMTREGVQFLHNGTITTVSEGGDKLYQVDAMFEEITPYSDQFNTVVLAVGREPSTETLGLENVGITPCSNCKIPINDRDQSVVKNIFAIGDCANGRPELSSAAVAAGRLLVKRLYKGKCNCKVQYRSIPTSLFTWPEYACCGTSEIVAVRLHGRAYVKTYKAAFTPLEQAVTEPASKCYAKLVTIADHMNVERLAGFHMVGPSASEIIQGFALALTLGATKKDLDTFVGIHPTCAEVFTNLSGNSDEVPQAC